MKDEVDFLLADKRQMFSHIENHFRCVWQGMSKIIKLQNNNSSQCLYNISKKRLEMK